MANLATKAPNFTRENAAEMARRATKSRLARITREKMIERHASTHDPDDARNARVKRQVDLLLDEMDRAKSWQRRDKISRAIERLWKLVQPTAGALRPGRRSRVVMPEIVPIPASPAGNGTDEGTQGTSKPQ